MALGQVSPPHPLSNAQAKCGNLLRKLVLRWCNGMENGYLCNTLDPTENVFYYLNLVLGWGNDQRNCHECSTLGPPGRVLCTEKLVSLGNMAKLLDGVKAQEESPNPSRLPSPLPMRATQADIMDRRRKIGEIKHKAVRPAEPCMCLRALTFRRAPVLVTRR